MTDLFELRRKAVHFLLGIALSLLIYFGLLRVWMAALVLALALLLHIFYRNIRNPAIDRMMELFERPDLRKKIPARGGIALFSGLILLMLLFEKNTVLASLMIWTFGDGISSLVGKHYGKHAHIWNDQKLVEGTLAGIIAAAIAASFFVPVYAAIIASIVAMVLESLEFRFLKNAIDDNFLVPMVA